MKRSEDKEHCKTSKNIDGDNKSKKNRGNKNTVHSVQELLYTGNRVFFNLLKGYQIPYLSHPDFTSRLSEFKVHQLLRYISSSMADLQIHSSIGKSQSAVLTYY